MGAANCPVYPASFRLIYNLNSFEAPFEFYRACRQTSSLFLELPVSGESTEEASVSRAKEKRKVGEKRRELGVQEISERRGASKEGKERKEEGRSGEKCRKSARKVESEVRIKTGGEK